MANSIDSKQIKIIQINTQHSKGATDELMRRLELEGPNRTIVLLQEPYTYSKKQKIPGVPKNFHCCMKSNCSARSAILASRNIKILASPKFTETGQQSL